MNLKAGPGEIYVVAHYTVKNTQSVPLADSDIPEPILVDAEGQDYSRDIVAAISAAGSDEGGVEDVNPRVSVKRVAVWKIDKASFDASKWRIVVPSDPQIIYTLK